MPVDWVTMVKQAGGFVTSWASQQIATAPDRRLRREAESQAQLAAPLEEPGCPACTIHEEISKARGHFDGIVAVAGERNGEIPAVIRPTVLLARGNLRIAREETLTMAGRAPSLRALCDELGACIDRAIIDTPDPQALTAESAAHVRDELVVAHVKATELAVAFYELERRVRDDDQLRTLYAEAVQSGMTPDEFYERLKERLSA